MKIFLIAAAVLLPFAPLSAATTASGPGMETSSTSSDRQDDEKPWGLLGLAGLLGLMGLKRQEHRPNVAKAH